MIVYLVTQDISIDKTNTTREKRSMYCIFGFVKAIKTSIDN